MITSVAFASPLSSPAVYSRFSTGSPSVPTGKETQTFTITGNLIYNSALTDYSTNDVRKVGYFAALDLDWSKMGGEYKPLIL